MSRTKRVLLLTFGIYVAWAMALAMTGCGGAYRVHPGAAGYTSGVATPVQVFASQSYDTISATDAIIQQARADFLAGKFPASSMPKIKIAFNTLVSSYDVAQQTWTTFNNAASNDQTPLQASLQAAIAAMQAAQVNFTTVKGSN